MFNPIVRIAAVVLAVVAVGTLLMPPRAAAGWEALVKQVVEAKTARFEVSLKPEGLAAQKAKGLFLAPNQYRQEFADGVVGILDFEHGKMVSFIPKTKQAMIFELKSGKDRPVGQGQNYFGDLREILAKARANKDNHVKELGEKTLDGRRVFGFRMEAMGQTTILWGDAQTGRLSRIECVMPGPPKTEVIFSDFEFDVPLDASLFSSEPPAGFTVMTASVDVSPASEQDFIVALGEIAKLNGGVFPPALDASSIGIALAKVAMDNLEKSDSETQKLMTKAISLGRGISFAARLPASAEAHYAGKGVKSAGPKTPIFWWRPTAGSKWRVIYSDLSAADTEQAPGK